MYKDKNCKGCESKKCMTCAEHQARAFELEVDEELQQERLTLFWKKYSWLVYTSVVAILATVVGVESYDAWRTKTRLYESDLFEKSALLANSNHTQQAISGFEQLADNAKTGYRTLARLELADIWMKEGQKDKALDLLKTTVIQTKESDPLHHVTILTLVNYQLDDAQPNVLLDTLQPSLNNVHFQGMATELAVLLLKKQNKKAEAKELIQKALVNPNITPALKSRLNTLMGE